MILIGLTHLSSVAQKNQKLEYIAATLSGTSAHITVLFLTWFNTRYSVVLLPFAIMLVSHMPSGMAIACSKLKNLYHESAEYLVVVNEKQPDRRIQILGLIVLVLLGLLAILVVPVLGKSLSTQRVLSLIFFLIIEVSLFVLLLKKYAQVRFFLSGWFNHSIIECHPLVKTGFVLVVALVLIWNAPSTFGAKWMSSHDSVENWLHGRFLLQGKVSLSRAYPELLERVDRENTRILTPTNSMWALGLANLRMDGVHTIHLLPPFKDDSGDVEKFLNNLDLGKV